MAHLNALHLLQLPQVILSHFDAAEPSLSQFKVMDVKVRQMEGRGQQQHWQRTSACPPVFQRPSMAYLIHSEEKHPPLPHLNLLKIIFSDQN